MTAATSYTPLHDPERGVFYSALSLDEALRCSREVLEEKATANIHDHDEMLRAAVSLEMCLRQLVTALDKEAAS